MGWSVHLIDDRGHDEGSWDCTHNINGMIRDALDRAGITLPPSRTPCYAYNDQHVWTWYPEGRGTVAWWEHLDGMPGPEGAGYITAILDQLEADPDRYRAMNPENGWGDYDGLVKVLRGMRAAVPEWPSEWRASG